MIAEAEAKPAAGWLANEPDASARPAGDSECARRMQPWLGTYVEVAAYADLRCHADLAIDAAFDAVRLAHGRWSFHDPDSELSELNRQPGARVAVSSPTSRLLRLARAMMKASGGAFDVTLGGLLVEANRLPDHGRTACLRRGAAEDIELGHGWARLARPVRLTLDGIAKGYAVDLAVGALRRAGARRGWVNAGGDLRAFGDVTLPLYLRGDSGRLAPAGGLRDMAIASSGAPGSGDGDMSSFAGQVFGRDSRPVVPGAWSVLARSAWRADALTKVAACTPPDRRDETIRRLGGCVVGVAP